MKTRKIMVVGVDDMFYGMFMLGLTLAAPDVYFEIVRVASGCEARDKLIDAAAVSDLPDLVVTDFELPTGMEGLELLQLIRKMPELDELFVIMVAAQPTVYLQVTAKAYNCECFRKSADHFQLFIPLLAKRWQSEDERERLSA